MDSDSRIRVYISTPLLDGHDMPAKLLARVFRDAGMEVIFGGLRQSPEAIVSAAIQEDVDVIAIASYSGFHMPAFTRTLELLKQNTAQSIIVVGGGIIPVNDKEELVRRGVSRIFVPGESLEEVVGYIVDTVKSVKSSPG